MTRRRYTQDEIDYVKRNYADTPTWRIVEHLRTTDRAIYNIARRHGLAKSQAYLDGPRSGRMRPGDTRGAATRFRPGNVPHNKDTHWTAGGRSIETQFKPGNKPHNWRPVGSKRIYAGYQQTKIADTRNMRRDWKFDHVMLWEEHHGKVPKGHILVFKDGDRTNISIDNLELITRAENMRRNTIHRLPPELKQICQLKGRLNRTIRRIERREEQDG